MARTNGWHVGAVAVVLVALAGTALAQTASQPPGGDQPRRARPQQDGQRWRGQGDGPGFGGMGMLRNALERPTFVRRDVEAATASLALTQDQQDAITALFDGYEEQAQQIAQEQRRTRQAAMEAMREGGPEGAEDAWTKSAADQKRWRDERESLDKGFLSDVKSILTSDQQGKWESVNRSLVRGQSMRQGTLSGERVDVLALVGRLELSETDRSALNPVLEQYELDVDRELAARDKVTTEAVNAFTPSDLFDPDKREDLTKRIEERRAASEKVRDVNTRFSKQVSALLPEAAKSKFDAAYREASFPDIYRTSQAGRALETAAGFGDLTDEQKTAVAELTASYEGKLAEIRPRQEAAWLEVEKNFSAQNMMGGGRGDRGGDREDAGRELRQERRQLDERTVEDLKAILTPEQAAKLPEPEQERRQRGGGGAGGRGGANTPDGA